MLSTDAVLPLLMLPYLGASLRSWKGMRMTIRILIAEHEAVYRAGLRALLEKSPEFIVVGEAANSAGVIKATRLWETQILLLDIALTGAPGVRGLVRTLGSSAKMGILLLAMFEDRYLIQELLELGARGCILKESTEGDLIQAAHAVASGMCYIDLRLTRQGVHAPCERTSCKDGEQLEGLTSVEQDLCRFMAIGFTHPELAEKFGISENAVETHWQNIMAKLGLHSRADLVQFATIHGLYPKP